MRIIRAVIPVATALAMATAAFAQQPQQPPPGPGPGYGMGPGMMGGYGPGQGGRGGYGPGYGGGYGPGYGMGPGMMGGYGPGYGMGPGMMGGYGYGMGPGMMMGGWGPGMMGFGGGMMGGLWQLDLTDAQRQQILKIQDDVRRKNWDLMGKTLDEDSKLRDAYASSGKRDRAAIVAAYKRIGDLRQQRIENSLEAAEKIEGVLTPQQRDQLKRWGSGWMMDTPQ
ncbi:MAG TPA: Spy/CpxP family protein refolding chaperone [Burkholderiales bacterium]|nr:Spy/CpxP family protein refolding chaperone [Burkholderiales bacterium]